MKVKSKLPSVGTTIFTVMSKLATEHRAINLSQGFPNFDCNEALKERVNFYLSNGKNQYVPMAGLPALRDKIADKIALTYQASVDPETEITVTAGATQALFTAIAAFIQKGDEVILIEPAYDSYAPAIEVMGGKVVPYALSGPDFKIDWSDFEQLISARTKMIIINTPHNPIGKTLKKSDIKKLEELTNETDIIVVSDEVYEHLIYDGQVHQSVLLFPELYKRSLVIYSFGKTFHNTGWKVGYCIAPDYLTKEFRKVHQFNVFCVNSFVQYGLADFLSEPSHYLELPNFYQQKRDYFSNSMNGSALKALPSEGTYFQLFDYSAISTETDTDFAKRMTTEFGVASIPLSVFYTEPIQNNCVRLCFAKTEETLSEAAKRLKCLT